MHRSTKREDEKRAARTRYLVAVLVMGLGTSHLGCDALKKKAVADSADAGATTADQPTQTSTVTCGGRMVLTYVKKTFDVASGPALFVGGDCTVSCTDCTIKAPDGIFAGGNGSVTLIRGTLEGSHKAIDVAGHASIVVKGTQITGKTVRGGGATITGVPGLTDDGQTEKFGKGACAQLFDCYEEHSQFGHVSGKVTAKIGADGHATGATYSGGTASADVQKCMIDRAKAKTVAGAGKAGNLVCSYSGEYDKGGQSMDYDEKFQ